MTIEEEERAQRLVLRGGGYVPASGETREEARDLGLAKLARVPSTVEAHEASDPGYVRLLGPAAVVPSAERSAHLVQKP